MSWFEEKQADQRWMQGKRGAKMARELESLRKPSVTTNEKAKSKSPGREAGLVSFFDSTATLSIEKKLPDLLDKASISRPDENDAIEADGASNKNSIGCPLG